jgi:hypothetical protein
VLLATVEEELITLDDFQRLLTALPAFSRTIVQGPVARQDFLDGIIAIFLLAKEADRLGLLADPTVEQAVDIARSEAITVALTAQARLEDVDDDELLAYYQANLHRFQQRRILRTILLVVAEQEQADALRHEYRSRGDQSLRDSFETFRMLVDAHSIDAASRANRGELGFLPGGEADNELPAHVFDAVDELTNPGWITQPLEVSGGWALLVLQQRRRAINVSFEDARGTLETELRAERALQARKTLLDELRTAATFDVRHDLLETLEGRREAALNDRPRRFDLTQLSDLELHDRLTPRREPGAVSETLREETDEGTGGPE